MKTQSLRAAVLVMLALLAGPAGAMSQEAMGKRTHSAEVRTQVDETLVWNRVMLDAIVASTLGNPQTMRMAATVNTAMFDAQNSVGPPIYRPIFVTDRAPRGTHRRAAIVQAAYVTLKSFYPAQLSRFDGQRTLSLAEFESDDWTAVQRGLEWGEHVANQVLAWRETDGFNGPVVPFTGAGAVVGQWESATGTSMSAGNLAFTAPFVLTSNTQFQAACPRPWTTLLSPEYAKDFNEVATIGVKTGSSRTSDQTHIAFFFNGYATSDYLEAAIQIARQRRTSRGDNSRIFALLTIAMHDTAVTLFRAKRDFGMNPVDLTWRPILAIPKADLDGNPDTTPIADWVPLITTPNHPDTRPRILDHTVPARACSSASSAIATRSRSTLRSTRSSRDLRMVGSSHDATRGSLTWRRKESTRARTAACTSAARAMPRPWLALRSPTTCSNMLPNRFAGDHDDAPIGSGSSRYGCQTFQLRPPFGDAADEDDVLSERRRFSEPPPPPPG